MIWQHQRMGMAVVSDMAQAAVKRFHCSNCPHRFTFWGQMPVREGGVKMIPGRTYCKGAKKYRAFRSSDPKTVPPSWCPKRKNPCEVRVYTFKDNASWYLHHFLHKGESVPPHEFLCAVRASDTVDLTPAAFYSMLKDGKSASELLGTHIRPEEIVEIDDGLKPCCFYIRYGAPKYLPHWNTARARQNEYQRNAEDDSAVDMNKG